MRPLKNLTKRLKIWTINYLFKTYFKRYYYPFESADEKFLKLTKDEKIVYLMGISHFVDSKAYEAEFQEMVRTFYRDLATQANDEVLQSAYRLTLIFIRDLQNRLKERADKFKQII